MAQATHRKRQQDTVFYAAMVGIFSALIYWVIRQGSLLEKGASAAKAGTPVPAGLDALGVLRHGLQEPFSLLLVQILVILLAARALGWAATKVGQPFVVGEMVAGILLGPSLVGRYFPGLSAVLFAPASLGNIKLLSQVGLVLFMFVVGLDLDLRDLRGKAHQAVVISHASIVIPFALGLSLAYFLYGAFAPVGVGFVPFGLFMGIAMSITAFPVLARIVQERGMQRTPLGALVITCAATDDITAWCLLAAVVALVKAGSFAGALPVLALVVAYVLLMLKVVRPLLARFGTQYAATGRLPKAALPAFLITLVFSALIAEAIGIHALFGAFLAGTIMPSNEPLRALVSGKVREVTVVLLLPLFFVFTGLRTEIGLLSDGNLWLVCGVIVAVAVAGKFLGSALAARFVGHSWHDSLSIGALMNTRGLMELVVLNIGYDLGILSAQIFTMMVIMALATTCLTGPALNLIEARWRARSVASAPAVQVP